MSTNTGKKIYISDLSNECLHKWLPVGISNCRSIKYDLLGIVIEKKKVNGDLFNKLEPFVSLHILEDQ